ncbi:hypothetical protein [Desulfoluna butyratoxydans]|uniref:hypothetical protein n=1 Tax=Desulfoluna butyratoxydans TaxID=231438 RepID=UPI0015D3A60F|nr:hypothetical protein [Desulfoluna butyratoxydans]
MIQVPPAGRFLKTFRLRANLTTIMFGFAKPAVIIIGKARALRRDKPQKLSGCIAFWAPEGSGDSFRKKTFIVATAREYSETARKTCLSNFSKVWPPAGPPEAEHAFILSDKITTGTGA